MYNECNYKKTGDDMNLETYISKLKHLNNEYDFAHIIEAYNFAKEAHSGQKRKSGEDFFIHPLHVSLILAELKMDEETIIASLLHDVIEDTEVSKDEIEEKFGEVIAQLVDGVTKLGKIHYESKEKLQAENLRKMFLAMAEDIRVILIKLADRLHNLRTLQFMPDHKKKEKAKETLEIYAPIAHRLGISTMKWELEDKSLQYLEPEYYYELVDKIKSKRSEREKIINKNIDKLKEAAENQFDLDGDINIYGRAKHFYSIYKKMKDKNKSFDEIFDLIAIRILVDDVKDCYSILGICHTIWKPIPGRFKDYIAMPKSNMYQSLHTTVITETGDTLEIQIRTREMHKIAEYGIAAHWKYKKSGKNDTNEQIERKLNWIKQVMEYQKETEDPEMFIDSLKIDLYVNEVFVFTPDGDVKELPKGSTPIDFAYAVHSEVGNQCVGAKVNGKIVPLNYELSTGEIVSVITKKNSGPSRDWLNIVQSNKAKNKIKRWFKHERRDENIEKGRSILESTIKRSSISLDEVHEKDWLDPIIEKLNLKTKDDLYEAIGYGGVLLKQVIPKLKELKREDRKKTQPTQPKKKHLKRASKRKKSKDLGVEVKGLDDTLTRFAKCCHPVPGDEIIGYVTSGRGITIHRVDCPNLKDLKEQKHRFIEVNWHSDNEGKSYEARIQIVAHDRKKLLSEITLLINKENFRVNGLNARTDKGDIAYIEVQVEINSKSHLSELVRELKNIKGVMEINRITI